MRSERDFTPRLLPLLADAPDGEPGWSEPADRIRRYMTDFTGRAFTSYCGPSDDPRRITSSDILATALLSIRFQLRGHEVRPSGAIEPEMLLRLEAADHRTRVLLAELDPDLRIFEVAPNDYDAILGPGSPADRLFSILRDEVRLPRVATHKLLARLRPHLFPIRDAWIDRAMGAGDAWWRPWWNTMRPEGPVRERLDGLREATRTHSLSLLRVADIAIWMRTWDRRSAEGSPRIDGSELDEE